MMSKEADVILFDAASPETKKFTTCFRSFSDRLKNDWQTKSLKGSLTEDSLNGISIYIIIITSNRELSVEQIELCQNFIRQGKKVLLLASGCQMNSRSIGSINAFTEFFGIRINNDMVIRTQFLKYFHPAQALVEDSLSPGALLTNVGGDQKKAAKDRDEWKFVYPYGSTLKLKKGQCARLVSSGSLCYPNNQPLAALYRSKASKSRLLVVGSTEIFSDAYLEKENNKLLLESLLQCLTGTEQMIDSIGRYSDAEHVDYTWTPDLVEISTQITSCIQEAESEIVPSELEQLFDSKLFSIDYKLWPEIIRAYEWLGIEYGPLTLIEPTFEQALPSLKPSTFAALFRLPRPPKLELVDLDQEFCSERQRLDEEAAKYDDGQADLVGFVLACANVLDVSKAMSANKRSAKHVLYYVCKQVAQFKAINQECGID